MGMAIIDTLPYIQTSLTPTARNAEALDRQVHRGPTGPMILTLESETGGRKALDTRAGK